MSHEYFCAPCDRGCDSDADLPICPQCGELVELYANAMRKRAQQDERIDAIWAEWHAMTESQKQAAREQTDQWLAGLRVPQLMKRQAS